jgi:hypothetical protein
MLASKVSTSAKNDSVQVKLTPVIEQILDTVAVWIHWIRVDASRACVQLRHAHTTF